MRRHSVSGKLFWSYVIIAVVALILNAGMYGYTTYHALNNAKQNHNNEASKLEYQLNTIINDGINRTKMASSSYSIREVLNISINDAYYGEDVLNVKELLEYFGNAMTFSESLDSLMLYDMKQDTLVIRKSTGINTILHKEETKEYMYDIMGLDAADIKDFAQNKKISLYIIPQQNDKWTLYCVMNIYLERYDSPNGYIIGEISSDKIEEFLKIYEYEGSHFYLVSKIKGYLGSELQIEQMINSMSTSELQKGEIGVSKAGMQSYIYSKIDTIVPDLVCYYTTDYTVYYGALETALLLIVITIFGIMIGSVIIARYFAKKNTEPLKRIMNTINPEIDAEKAFTYSNIEEQISVTINKMHDLEKKWKNECISLMLNGQKLDKKIIQDYGDVNIKYCERGYRVLCAHLVDVTEESDRDILLFCIANIIEEVLGEINACVPVKNWDCVYFILKNDADWDQCLQNISQGIEFMKTQLSLHVAMGLSMMFFEYDDMSKAKVEADCAMEYSEFSGIYNFVTLYEKMSELTDNANQEYGNLYRSFAKRLLASDYREALLLEEEIWKKYLKIDYPDIQLWRARMLSIVSVISIQYRENIGELDVDFVRTRNGQELQKIAVRLIEELIRFQESDFDSCKLFEKMDAFIRDNYADANMGVGYVCEHFHLSYTYVTGIFKKYTGEGVVDYFQKYRIIKGKEMLAKGKTVAETAEMLGYTDARGFIRVFKKYEGITPGQYKLQ